MPKSDSPSFMGFVQKHPYVITFAASAAIGCFAFIAIYGFRILDGTNIDWILRREGDFVQSYLGWCFYRASDWQWPLGLMENAAYPSLTPILYIDSVPLFNLLFKILSPLLPETFQFFGIWGLTCFALAGGIGGCIIYRLTKSIPYSVLSSVFFSLTTFAIQRLYEHTALAANWVILLTLLTIVTFESKAAEDGNDPVGGGGTRGLIARAGCWFGCFLVAVGVNIYYVPIIGILLLAYCIYDAIMRRRVAEAICWLAGALMGTVFTFYLFGGFYHLGSTSIAPAGLGFYSANLNALLNPMEYGGYLNGFSTLLPTAPMATKGQYEGFAYLGAGLILLCIIAVIGVVTCGAERRKELFGNQRAAIIATIVTIAALIVASTGGLISLNGTVIAKVEFPQPLLSIIATFRSSGRFAWGAWDIVAIMALALIYLTFTRKRAMAIILAGVLVQCVDLTGVAIDKHREFAHKPDLSTEQWDGWRISWKALDDLMEGKEHLVYADDEPLWIATYYDTAFAALRNDASISDFYYSRKDEAAIAEYKESIRDALGRGETDGGILYLFANYNEAKRYIGTLHLYYLDGLIFGSSQAIDGFEEIASINEVVTNEELSPGSSMAIPPETIGTGDICAVIAATTDSDALAVGVGTHESHDVEPVYYAVGRLHVSCPTAKLPLTLSNISDEEAPMTVSVFSITFA